jgi:hypothetical protein
MYRYLHRELTEKLWKMKRAPVSDPKATCSPDLDPGEVDKVTGSFSGFTKFPLHICKEENIISRFVKETTYQYDSQQTGPQSNNSVLCFDLPWLF